MADEDITLDGKPLQSLRVADLKAALEQRNLPKSGQKNTLIKRLKGALMLENLQKSSSSHIGLQPNSQIGEEMCQNSFIKQYLAKQQELLRQRLEREAQEEEDGDESPAGPEDDDDHSEDNDSSSYASDKQHRAILPQPSVAKPDVRGGDFKMGHGSSPSLLHQESPLVPGTRMQRAMFQQGHKEPPAPSPPRAVASLSVRVLGQPDSQGLPPAAPRAQEKEGTAPSEPGTAHSVLHLSRSARSSAGNHVPNDSDEDDDGDDESDDDEDWGPGTGGARRGKKAPPPTLQMAPSVSSAAARSKRKLQPPQHIPPPQVHHLRHPTPPPSPPPNLFPLPDTPKQSPPDTDDQEGEGPQAARGPGVVSFPPHTMQRQDSDSSSRSSSPEPPVKRRPGPLSLLVHKMESEEATSASRMSGETAHSTAGCSSGSQQQGSETKRQQLSKEMEEKNRLKAEKERDLQQELEREKRKTQEQERERKLLDEDEDKKRKQREEEKKQQQKEDQERERKRQEEEKEKKRQDEERKREAKKIREDQEKRQEKANKDRVVVTEAQDSDSSSDSGSKSDSSSKSSSSSSSRDKIQLSNQMKKAYREQEAEDDKKSNLSKGLEKRYLSKREVSEPSTAAVTEVEPDSESSMAQQPASGAQPESSESRPEESTTPKAFAARKISLTSSKASPASTDGGAGELDAGNAAGRKRRWGSSTAVTAKKPSISITTDSLKSLIPDIKMNQEAVVELHPEELQLSGDEENLDTGRGDPDKGLKIRRTVTQVVPGDGQENGQSNEEEEQVEKMEGEKQRRTSRDKRKNSLSEEASETPKSVDLDGETKKVTPSDSLVRRSISQQKSGVSVTIDDPVRATRQPSPPRGKVSNIIHVTNLVRPFTLLQLKELLNRTGSVVEEGFWIDKIKSHCFVTYATTEEAVATRAALHGVKWPPSNPKVLSVDFSEQDEVDFHKGVLKPDKEEDHSAPPSAPQTRLPPLMPERERDRDRDRDRERDRERDRGVRDLWAERQREMERRERARGEREWDRDKIREFARPGEDGRKSRSRSRDRERKRRERAKSKERKTDKKAEKADEPPAKLLDDLFLKTKAAPCIYWLPLTEEQAAQRILDRTERQKERERRRKEQEEENKKRDEEKKDRLKGREKDGSAAAGGIAAGRGADGDRGRDREGDKRRDSSHRSRRPSQGAGSGRRSHSRSNPRDRRR